MKRMKQFVYALLIGCVLLTGCGSNTNTTETKEEVISDSQANASTEATQSESASEEENDSVTGRIESIDETSITLAVMNMPGGAAPDGNGGAPNGEAPNGQKPEKDMLDEMTLTLSGDTMTITVNDDTIITIDGEDATLDELQVGDTVSFFLDGEIVTSLSVGMPEPTQPMQAPEQN